MTMCAAGANGWLWYHTATARPPIPRSSGAARADVVVVGGGLTGLSAALHLLEKGVRVVVVEADEIGSGASGRNGGFVVPHFARSEPDDVVRNLGEGGERDRLVHIFFVFAFPCEGLTMNLLKALQANVA